MTNCFYYIDGLISNSLQKLFLKIKLFKNLKKKKKILPTPKVSSLQRIQTCKSKHTQ